MNLFFVTSKKFEQEVSRQVAEACDQITSEMGAEIHDDLIQKLSIFRLYLDRLEQSVHNPDETARLLLSMRSDFENVIQSVRRISRQLMPVNTADSPLSEGIKLLCQDMERPVSGNIHLEVSGDEQRISLFSATYLLRIIQELIHNAFKHSSAWHIWVRLEWSSKYLIIEVEDDGTGFHRISDFIDRLRAKNNTLRMRSQTLGASLTYHHGKNGLLARVQYRLVP
jgi:signal transduction histidine kinase